LKSARRRRAIEVAGPRSQKERGQRTQGGQSITAWRGCQRTKRAGKALFVSALTRANPPFKAFSGTVGYITPQIHYVPFGKPKIHFDFGVSILTHYNLSEAQPLEKTRFVIRMGYLF
jgi:hypothetical protein